MRCVAQPCPTLHRHAVKKLLHENQLPHLLFYGPPGTGKTSTILAIARQIYGKSMSSMTLELNASDDRGINIVRNEIQDFASTRTIFRCERAYVRSGLWVGVRATCQPAVCPH